MRRFIRTLMAAALIVSMSGCLGTVIQSPKRGGQRHSTTTARIIAAPRMIDATHCREGMAQVETFVPIWGLVVGILTFGILVPITSSYTCVASSG